MKILMLGWELPPHNSGGLGVACYNLAKALSGEGVQLDFVLPYRLPKTNMPFMNLHHVNDEPVDPTLPENRAKTAYDGRCNRCRDLSYCRHDTIASIRSAQKEYKRYIEKHVVNHQPTIIHTHDWLTIEAGIRAKELTGAPLVAHVHATEFDRAANNFGNPLIHEIEQHGLLMADRIIAVSNATKNTLINRYQIPADKIEVIHNGTTLAEPIDQNQYVKYAYLRTLQREGYMVVTTLGRLTLQKGLSFFLQAAAIASERFDRFVFVIAGDGEQRNELIELSVALGIADKVIFTGFVRGQAWRDLYGLSDIFVMSSVSEPFGLTALEAAQHNNAVLLTRQSGVGEVLHHVLRYDYWDTQRLADQLVNLAVSRSLRSELADNVKIELGQMSWDKIAKRFMHEYIRLGKGSTA